MEKKLLNALIALQKRLDMLINLTPTGTERNIMTEENIIALTLINECEKSNCQKNCGNTQPSGNPDNICLNCGSSIIEDKFFQITSNGADDEFDGNQVLRLKAGDIGTLNIFRTEDRITVDVYSADDDDYVDSMSVTDNDLRLVSCDNCKHINREDELFCGSCKDYSNFDKYVK